MRRLAWRMVVTVSAALSLAAAGGWARGRFAHDTAAWRWVAGPPAELRTRSVALDGYAGSLLVTLTDTHLGPPDAAEAAALTRALAGEAGGRVTHAPAEPLRTTEFDWAGDLVLTPRGGFGWAAGDRFFFELTEVEAAGPFVPPTGSGATQTVVAEHLRMVAAPWWSLALGFALAPAGAAWAWRRQRRRPAHACRDCGYDLRATADANGPRLATCPECGRTTAAARPA